MLNKKREKSAKLPKRTDKLQKTLYKSINMHYNIDVVVPGTQWARRSAKGNVLVHDE